MLAGLDPLHDIPRPPILRVKGSTIIIYACPTHLVNRSKVHMLLLHLDGLGYVGEAVVPLVHGAQLLHLQAGGAVEVDGLTAAPSSPLVSSGERKSRCSTQAELTRFCSLPSLTW